MLILGTYRYPTVYKSFMINDYSRMVHIPVRVFDEFSIIHQQDTETPIGWVERYISDASLHTGCSTVISVIADHIAKVESYRVQCGRALQ